MSDVSLGPDWWVAGDGKWYPPQLRRPGTGPAPAPAHAGDVAPEPEAAVEEPLVADAVPTIESDQPVAAAVVTEDEIALETEVEVSGETGSSSLSSTPISPLRLVDTSRPARAPMPPPPPPPSETAAVGANPMDLLEGFGIPEPASTDEAAVSAGEELSPVEEPVPAAGTPVDEPAAAEPVVAASADAAAPDVDDLDLDLDDENLSIHALLFGGEMPEELAATPEPPAEPGPVVSEDPVAAPVVAAVVEPEPVVSEDPVAAPVVAAVVEPEPVVAEPEPVKRAVAVSEASPTSKAEGKESAEADGAKSDRAIGQPPDGLIKGGPEFKDIFKMAMDGNSLANAVQVKYDAASERGRAAASGGSGGGSSSDDGKGRRRGRRR